MKKFVSTVTLISGFLFLGACSYQEAKNVTGSSSNQGSAVSISSEGASNTIPSSNKAGVSISSGESHQAPTANNPHEKLIKDTLQLARQGKAVGCEFIVGKTLIDEIHQKWGEPDKPIQVGDPYEVYSPGMGRGSFAFGIGRGEVIYDIRNFGIPMDKSRDISQLTKDEIRNVLGSPNQIRHNKQDEIFIYQAGEYQLKFVLRHVKQDGKNPHVHHISIYSPKGAAPMGGSAFK